MPTGIYADTSALAKLFLSEPESNDLRRWLAGQPEPRLMSSALLSVELVRLLAFVKPSMVPAAQLFLASDIGIMEVTPPILSDAMSVPPTRLRALDALHLATAIDLKGAVDIFLTYDKQLVEAARHVGFAVAAPGAPY